MYVVSAPWLFQLPNAWLVAFLSEWLDMPSIGTLDMAISSNEYRPSFLRSLQSMRSTDVDSFSDRHREFLGYENGGWTGWWWRWLSIRQIYIKSIIVDGDDVRSDLVIPSLQKVVADSFTDDDLYYLVRNCPALRCLRLDNDDDLEPVVTHIGLNFLTDLRQSLEELSYYVSYSEQYELYGQTTAALINVLRQCPKFQKLYLTGYTWCVLNLEELSTFGHILYELELRSEGRTIAAAGQAIPNFLNSCKNLRKIYYEGDEDEEIDRGVLAALHRSCLSLEVLDLHCVSFDTTQASLGAGNGSQVRRHWKHLRILKLGECELTASSMRDIAGMETLKELLLDHVDGLAATGLSALSTMKLEKLSIYCNSADDLPADCLQSFVGSNISQTLETFILWNNASTMPIDDVDIVIALASCRLLKILHVSVSNDGGCVFGRNGLDGLTAMVTGCPLLVEIKLWLTAGGIHHLGTHGTNLKTCIILNGCAAGTPTPLGFPSYKELRKLYPAIGWRYRYLVEEM